MPDEYQLDTASKESISRLLGILRETEKPILLRAACLLQKGFAL